MDRPIAAINDSYQTSNMSRTLEGNKILHHSDEVGALPVSAAPTTYSFSLTPGFILNFTPWPQCIGQRQLQDVKRIIQVLGFGASYIRDFMVYIV